VIWGALHGVALVLHKWWKRLCGGDVEKMSTARSLCGVLVTFHFVAFCWIFFRAADIDVAFTVIGRIFSVTPLSRVGDIIAGYDKVLAVIAGGFLIHWCPAKYKDYVRGVYVRLHTAWKVLLAVALFFALYQMKSTAIQPFIYFQF